MTKPEYKILIVRDGQGFCDYTGWLTGDFQANYQIQEIQFADYLIAFQVNRSLNLSQLIWADCILWDSEISSEFLEHLEHLSVPIVIIVAEPEQLTGLNFLLKASLTKELLNSTICHGITQAKIKRRLDQAEAILKEQVLLKKKLQLEQSVNLLLQSIHSSFDLSTIFTAATTGLGKLLKLDRVEITQYLSEQEIWTPLVEYLDRQDIPSSLGKVIPDQNNEISRKLKQGEIVIINSYTDVECSINQDLLEEYPGSWLIVPLVVGSTVWGVISLDCHHRYRHWLDMEIDLAINISTQLAIAIQQSEFYHQLQIEVSQRQKTKNLLELQNQFLGCIAMGDPLPETLTLVTQLLEVYMTEGIYAILIFDDQNYLECIAAPSLPEDYRQAISDMTRAEAEATFGDSWGLNLNEPSSPKYQEFIASYNLNFCWSTPIMDRSQQKLLGIFVLYHRQPQPSTTEIQINRIVAHVVGIAIERHENELDLRNQLKREKALYHQLERELRDRQAAEAKQKKAERDLILLNQELESKIEKRTVDLRRSKEILQISEQRFRNFFTFAPIGIAVVDAQTYQLVAVNQAYCQFLGYSEDELLKIEYSISLSKPADWELEMPLADSLIRGSINSYQLEQRYIQKNGTIVIGDITATKICDRNGNVTHIIKMVEDITEQKQDKEALNYQYERQSFITKITQQIRQSLDLDEVLSAAVNEVNKLLNCDRVIIFQLLDNGDNKVVREVVKEIVKMEYPSILDMSWKDEHFSDEGFEYYINSKSRIVNDVPQDDFASCIADFMAFAQVKSKIVAPIVQNIQSANPSSDNRWQQDNSQLWGLLIVHSCGEQRQWQPEEADLLQQVANQLAIAIQQADLYTQIANELSTRKHLELELSRQAAADRLLSEITMAINESSQLDQVLDLSLQKVLQLLESDRVLIFQIGADGQGKVVKEAVTNPALSILDRIIEDSCFVTSNLGEQYLHGKFTILEDTQTANLTPCYAELMEQSQIRANLAAPIIHSNKLWGLLLVHQCHTPRVWLPHEINLIKQVATQIGISAHKEKLNLRLISELNQKEILLKEIHHRVKNNLQVMSSLLRMQFRKSTPEVRVLCEEYQNQIQSMALIHDQLHQSNDLGNINFHSYIRNLANNLFQCYGANSELVQLNLSVDNIFLPLDQSIPLGLIINELISNALKYAFPKGFGQIDIALSQSAHLLQLVVADNGVGIAEGFDLETATSMGLQLIYSLADQLGGEVIRHALGDTSFIGTRFEITFPID